MSRFVLSDRCFATAELPLKVSDTTLEITPDPALLHSEDTVFPLYIDPPTKGIALGDWTAQASDGITTIPRVMSQTVSA